MNEIEQVWCEGWDVVQDEPTHPRVYYTLKEDKNNLGTYRAVCFYCGKKWEKKINE
jgi:uncharacterized Zn-finger protein